MKGHDHGPGCRDLAARLSDYLDRDLDPEVCARIDQHLGDCPACRDFLESLRRTVGLVRQTTSPHLLPDELKRRIVEAYRKAEKA